MYNFIDFSNQIIVLRQRHMHITRMFMCYFEKKIHNSYFSNVEYNTFPQCYDSLLHVHLPPKGLFRVKGSFFLLRHVRGSESHCYCNHHSHIYRLSLVCKNKHPSRNMMTWLDLVNEVKKMHSTRWNLTDLPQEL